jgi:hypothetical protein
VRVLEDVGRVRITACGLGRRGMSTLLVLPLRGLVPARGLGAFFLGLQLPVSNLLHGLDQRLVA